MTITESNRDTGTNRNLQTWDVNNMEASNNRSAPHNAVTHNEDVIIVNEHMQGYSNERDNYHAEVNDKDSNSYDDKGVTSATTTITTAATNSNNKDDKKSDNNNIIQDKANMNGEDSNAENRMIAEYVENKWLAAVHNKNVFRVLLFCAIDGAAHSIWNQQVYQVLIHQIAGDTAVGWMSAASGVSQMFAAVIAGVFGDRWKREWILRSGAIAGFIAVLLTYLGVAKMQMAILYIAQTMWGAYSGIAATGTEAIFADSVATGRRAFVYNLKWMDQTLSSCVGIIATIILLVKMGNEWEHTSMIITMFVGLGVHPIAMLTLWTLRDKFALHESNAPYIDKREEQEREERSELEEWEEIQTRKAQKQKTLYEANMISDKLGLTRECAEQRSPAKHTGKLEKLHAIHNEHEQEGHHNATAVQLTQSIKQKTQSTEMKKKMPATDVVIVDVNTQEQVLHPLLTSKRYAEDKRWESVMPYQNIRYNKDMAKHDCESKLSTLEKQEQQQQQQEQEEEEEVCDIACSVLVSDCVINMSEGNNKQVSENKVNNNNSENVDYIVTKVVRPTSSSEEKEKEEEEEEYEEEHSLLRQAQTNEFEEIAPVVDIHTEREEECNKFTSPSSEMPVELSSNASPSFSTTSTISSRVASAPAVIHNHSIHQVELHDVTLSSPVELISCEEAAKRVSMELEIQDRLAWRRYRAKRDAIPNVFSKIWLTCIFAIHVLFSHDAVPYLVCLVDFLVAFGSGMTLRYLLLYFVEDYHTSPSVLMTATLIICPVQALFSYMVQYLGDYYLGRILSTIVVRVVGALLLLMMGMTHFPLWLLLPIYVVRNAITNSVRGVTRSVIMDSVKKENRAKWSAFESFSSFTWAGSAMVGGYIAEAKGYQFSFTITAYVHFFALCVLAPAIVGSLPVERALMQAKHMNCKIRAMRS